MPENLAEHLEAGTRLAVDSIVQSVSERNQQYFEAEMDKLDTWAEDLKQGLELERKRNDKRRKLFAAQDEIDELKDGLINQIEARLKQSVSRKPLFTVRWSVI